MWVGKEVEDMWNDREGKWGNERKNNNKTRKKANKRWVILFSVQKISLTEY